MRRTSIVWKYSKEELIEIVDKASSIRELVALVGLNNKSGSNDETVKKCLEFHGIDWKPLALKGSRHSRHKGCKKRSNEEIFIEHSEVTRNVVRSRILKNNLIPYKCAICGMEPEWNGKKLTFILDHINGVRDDHRLSNLRFVCPNCNAQLETTCGNANSRRRKELAKELEKTRDYIKEGSKRLNKCPVCGKLKSQDANVCLECYLEDHKSKKRPPKKDLINDIKHLSITKTGEKYGVSDTAVRKWLKFYNLPFKKADIKKFFEQ